MVAQTQDSVINMSFELGRIPTTFQIYRLETKEKDGPTLKNTSVRYIRNGVEVVDTSYFADEKKITAEAYQELDAKSKKETIRRISPEERSFTFTDGYATDEKTTEANLKMLVDVALKHPEKLLVAAGGNPTKSNEKIPDIRKARANLEKQGLWPKNLIIVGVEGRVGEEGTLSYFNGPFAEGADIYVPWQFFKKLDCDQASSFATPVVSEIARQLRRDKNLTPGEIKKSLTEMCVTKERNWDTSYRVLDL